MNVNKNKLTDEQRKIYEFIESNVSPAHRMEATLLMGHLSYIRDTCKKHVDRECIVCPFNSTHELYGDCLLKTEFPDEWQVEKMIKNIFSNLN